MHSSSRHGLRQVMPFGPPLPVVIDCIANIMSGASASEDLIPLHGLWFKLQQSIRLRIPVGRWPCFAKPIGIRCMPSSGGMAMIEIRRRICHRDSSRGCFLRKTFSPPCRSGARQVSFVSAHNSEEFSGECMGSRQRALKRGGGQVAVPVDLVEAETWYAPAAVKEAVTPESLFERRWALSVLEHVMVKFARRIPTASGKADQFDTPVTCFSIEESDGAPLRRSGRTYGLVSGSATYGRASDAAEISQVAARGNRRNRIHAGRGG